MNFAASILLAVGSLSCMASASGAAICQHQQSEVSLKTSNTGRPAPKRLAGVSDGCSADRVAIRVSASATSNRAEIVQLASAVQATGLRFAGGDRPKANLTVRSKRSTALTVAAAGPGEPKPEEALQEVIVTAQKFRQRAMDVPISLAVISASELGKTQVRDLGDLMSYVPGLTVEDTGIAVRIAIRGIGNIDGSGALVGTYLDDADVTTGSIVGIDLSTYDLARVEVLRGPQGTLYGEGSEGGTIRYITNKPDLSAFEMDTDVSALFDQYGAPGSRVVSVLNTPIVPGKLGLRVAADFDHEGGWVDQPAAGQKNVNGGDITDARIEARWFPTEGLTADATEVIHRASLGPVTGEDASGNYTQPFSLMNTPVQETNYNISNLTISWRPGGANLLNSTTYISLYNVVKNEGLIGEDYAPPTPLFEAYYPVNALNAQNRVFSDELRVADGGHSPWRWTVGAFYRRYTLSGLPFDAYFGLVGVGGPGLPASPVAFPATFLRSKSWSGFGDTSYLLFDRLTIGVGVRYFRDAQTTLALFNTQEQAATFTSTDPRVYLRYGISRDVNVYASAAKGFRSGGFNSSGEPGFAPEHVWTYELGTKMRRFGGRMSLDADVFLSNYDDYQSVGLEPPPNPSLLEITENAGTARIKGVEADVTWTPVASWRVGLSGDYIDARLVTINVGEPEYDVGDPLNLVSRYQATGFVEREFSWLDKAGSIRLDYSERAPAPYRDLSVGSFFYSHSDYLHLLNLDWNLQWNENLGLGFFAENLLNDRGYIGAIVIQNDSPRERPRTFGVKFDVRFD
jgi:iron complex outermembrane recepter protein